MQCFFRSHAGHFLKHHLLSLTLACALVLPLSAAPMISGLTPRAGIQMPKLVGSVIRSGAALSEDDAAMRLYYLDLITGTGTTATGSVTFDLHRDLTRLEGAVMAVRLMGMESAANTGAYSHPYTDVPDWASGYIGVLYQNGLTETTPDNRFRTGDPCTPDTFMSYMLYALGYRMNTDFRLDTASLLASAMGLCDAGADDPFTRGDAVVAMYNTLRAGQKNSDKMLSESLVESGFLSYMDAVFLLWSNDPLETASFMDKVGYRAEWIIPDGYYTIRQAGPNADSAKVLNVLADGPNRDYEGLGVCLWNATGDVSQSFRLERTERGTYLLYAACSRGGFHRALGIGKNGSAALYQTTSKNALEFSVQGTVDGVWTFVAQTAEGQRFLTANGTHLTYSASEGAGQSWVIEKMGIIDGAGRDLALFPCQTMSVTQGAYDDYSHQKQNALDIQPTNGMAFAPFNAKVVRVDPGETTCNGVWIQSTDKVRYADGSYDYMTVLFMHDNDISDLTVGRVLTQGEYFYQSGTMGNSSGAHIHVAVFRGAYSDDMTGTGFGSGNVNVEDALFVRDDTTIRNDYGLRWRSVGEAG